MALTIYTVRFSKLILRKITKKLLPPVADSREGKSLKNDICLILGYRTVGGFRVTKRGNHDRGLRSRHAIHHTTQLFTRRVECRSPRSSIVTYIYIYIYIYI